MKPIAFTAAVICLAALCSLARAQSQLERAASLARERKYPEAQQLLRGIAIPPGIPQAIAFHRLKAAVAAGVGNTSEAAAEMESALELAPQDANLLLASAVAELHAGQLETALERAKNAGPQPAALELIGDIEARREALPAAIAAYREAVRLAPANENYRATLAFQLIRMQSFRGATQILREAPARSARLLTLLGIAQYAGGDPEAAAETSSSAIALDAAAEPAYRSLTRIVLQSSAAPSGAIAAQLCSWNPTVCSAVKLRVAREKHDDAMEAQAIAQLERATDPAAHCELARAREWTGRLPDARTEMEACLASDPSPQNHYRLALIYRRMGLADLAQREIAARTRLLAHMTEQTLAALDALNSLK